MGGIPFQRGGRIALRQPGVFVEEREAPPARIRFAAGFREVGVTLAGYGEAEIRSETTFFRAELGFVRAWAGPITKAFVAALPDEWLDSRLVFDSWKHHLKPGQSARLPSAWHLDDVARTRADGQPEHRNPPYRPQHRAVLVGDVARPLFLHGQVELEDLPEGGGSVYAAWGREIDRLLQDRRSGLRAIHLTPGRVIEYGWGAFHKAMPAVSAGWRIFIRVARGIDVAAANVRDPSVPAYDIV